MRSHSWLPALSDKQSRDPDPFRALRTQMDQLFESFMGGFERPGLPAGITSPRIDVSETATELTVKADLPGVEEKDIEVTVAGDQLTIKAERKSEAEEKSDEKEKERVFHRVERSYGSMQRTMTAPFAIDPETVTASFKDGVLTLTVPKPADVQKQAKKIEIKRPA